MSDETESNVSPQEAPVGDLDANPAESPVADAPVADAPPVVQAPEEPSVADTHNHVAIRDFAARFAHQVLHFKKGDVIEPHIGAPLRASGSPIKLVEKATGETKGEL